MIKFHNATGKDGQIIHIDEVTKENRAEHYYCVGCCGEMSAVLGDKREHHFRHNGEHCSWESYLHKLGKMLLKQRFDTQKEFVIKYYVEHHCNKSNDCKLERIYQGKKCNYRELHGIDLKKYFDTCEEEVTYNGYRADLMLSSKEYPELAPIFLEISVTHDCEAEKLASGIQIIELKIANEKDVLRPLVEEDSLFGCTNPEQPYDFNALPPIRFFNFKRTFETAHPLTRFRIVKDDKGILRGYCTQENLTCRNVERDHCEDSIYEVAIPSDVLVNNHKPNFYEFGMMKAISSGINVKHCGICNKMLRCVQNYNETIEDKRNGVKQIVSHRVLMRDIIDKNFDKIGLANGCQNYTHNRFLVYQVLREMGNLPYWEWKRVEEEKTGG